MSTGDAPPPRTRIKICGITSRAAADAAVEAGADMLGFVVAAGSPRCIDLDRAFAIADTVPEHVTRVIVLRAHDGADALIDAATASARGWRLQIHGDETVAEVESIAADVADASVMRGFSYDDDAVRTWDACYAVDLLVIDGPAAGSGVAFDHEALAEILDTVDTPVLLAGGLRPGTVGAAIAALRPYGVDVSSGVERAPGDKDAALIAAFCAAVRDADRAIAEQYTEGR